MYRKYLPIFILLLFDLLLLPFLYNDYGIGWDENSSRDIGIHNALMANNKLGNIFYPKEQLSARIRENPETGQQDNYLSQDQLKVYPYRMYGPAFELGLVALERIFRIEKNRELYLFRHIMTHLFYLLGVFFFYLLLHHHFKDWRISILGTVMLLLIPRLFPHSFFNPKDIPFLVAGILAAYTMFRFLDKPGFHSAFWHGLICAFAIDIRIVGIIFPMITVGLMGAEILTGFPKGKNLGWHKYKDYKKCFTSEETGKKLKYLLIFGITLILFTILFWPYLWKNPMQHFLWSFKSMSKYPWEGSLLFRGEIYTPMVYLPASYFPVWFGITTPPVFLLGFFISLFKLFRYKLKSLTSERKIDRLHLTALLLLVLPGLMAIILKSVLYDGGRHFFFVYPFFIISALIGFIWLKDLLQQYLNIKPIVFYGGISLLLFPILIKMFSLHPFQYVYFNSFAGKNIEENFEADYWGISYKEGLDFVLKAKNENRKIRIMVGDSILPPIIFNSLLLKPEELEQIIWIKNMGDAEYFMTTYRATNNRAAYLEERKISSDEEVYSVYADDIKILSVFKIQKE